MPNRPQKPAKEYTGDFSKFTDFMRRLVAVPHSEIKAELDAEKESKKRKRTSKPSASRDAGEKR